MAHRADGEIQAGHGRTWDRAAVAECQTEDASSFSARLSHKSSDLRDDTRKHEGRLGSRRFERARHASNLPFGSLRSRSIGCE